MNYLIIQFRQLGDILLTTPCIKAIKDHNPEAKVFFLCHPMGKKILDNNPFLDGILTYDKGIREGLHVIRQIRDLNCAYIFDFMNNPRSALIAFAAKPSKSIAFNSSRQFAYSQTIPPPKRSHYIVQEKFELLKAAGIEGRDMSLLMATSDLDKVPYQDFLSENPKYEDHQLRIVISPTHKDPQRRWATEKFVAVASYLVAEHQAAVTWIWGPGEEELIDQCIAATKQKTYKAPKTTLKELHYFMSQHHLFIGGSNGPSHIAVAAGTPTLQIHGKTLAASWSPMTEKHRCVCASKDPYKADAKIDKISVEEVISEFEKMKLL